MGQLALLFLFLRAYVLVSIPVDKFENRRHVHVFPKLKGARGIIEDNWEYVNTQLTKSFNGEKTQPKEIKIKQI